MRRLIVSAVLATVTALGVCLPSSRASVVLTQVWQIGLFDDLKNEFLAGPLAEASEGSEAPSGATRLDPKEIRFSQSSFLETGKTEEGGTYTVEGNAQWLRDHPDQVLPWGGPIRVFRKEAFMDEWGPMTKHGYVGDPRNLVNGEIYTLDHRRLIAYRRAGRKSIPFKRADFRTVRDNRWKFTTPNGGVSIEPRH